MGRVYDIHQLAGILHDFRREPQYWRNGRPECVVCTSGGFDPPHRGHLACMRASKLFGDTLVVIVNGDGFLKRKKGYVVMHLEERLQLIADLEYVDYAVAWDDGGQLVDGAIRLLKPDVFTKGGDRSTPDNVAEAELLACREVGCRVLLGVGGAEKVQSSSKMFEEAVKHVLARTPKVHGRQ